jgi:hypothetical protein
VGKLNRNEILSKVIFVEETVVHSSPLKALAVLKNEDEPKVQAQSEQSDLRVDPKFGFHSKFKRLFFCDLI